MLRLLPLCLFLLVAAAVSAQERVAAFRGGRVAGFPSPPGVIHLAKGIPHRVILTTAELPKSLPFPYASLTTTKSYLASHRETIKRILMALIEGTHFFKTRKEESKRSLAKYAKQTNQRLYKQ